MLDNTRLRIAIQKSGRLSEDSRELLSRCGIKVNLHTQRLIALAENMPIDILRVRDDDIPGLVMDGVVDLGIIGENVLEEELLSRRAQGEDPRYFTLRRLDFGGCRLSLATPVDEAWNGPAALDGKRIATSYPHLLKRYLDQKGISFKSCLLNGSVEVAPRAGLADAICDLVSTGATLEANGLREVEVIYRSKACLIQRDGEMADAKQQLIDRLLTRIRRDSGPRVEIHHDARPDRTPGRSGCPAAGRRAADYSAAGRRQAARGDAHGQQRNPVLGDHGKTEGAGRQLHSGAAD